MKTSALLVVLPALLAQTANVSVQNLLNDPRPLTNTEVARVLDASRQALAGKRLLVSFAAGGAGPEVLMGPEGRPRLLRTSGGIMGGIVGGIVSGTATGQSGGATVWRSETQDYLTTIIDYTGRTARRCDGSVEPGELVVEYRHARSTNQWTVDAFGTTARAARAPLWAPLFDMLVGDTAVSSGEREQIDGRWARAFVASYAPPAPAGATQREIVIGDPMPNVERNPAPNDLTQSLWIDAESLLPIRWEAVYPATRERRIPAKPYTRLWFRYETSISLAPPEGVTPPNCIR